PESHHDREELVDAVQSIKEINVNINEYKRRKDLGKICLCVCVCACVCVCVCVFRVRVCTSSDKESSSLCGKWKSHSYPISSSCHHPRVHPSLLPVRLHER